MGRIKNTNKYPFDTPISPKDYVIGSDGNLSNNKTKNYRFADIINLILTQIGLSSDNNTILSGNVYWLEDLDFGSTPISYVYDGVLYTAPATELTLSDADATNPRIDVFAIDSTTNELVIVEGTPASSPQEPTVDFETQIRVTSVLVLNGETTPDEVNEELVYNENTGESTEWETVTSASTSVINLEDDTDPLLGSVNILCKSVPNGETITFSNDVEMDMDDFSSLNFGIKNLNTNITNLKIYLLNGNTIVSDAVYLTDGLYGYDNNNTSSYDIINIPASAFRLTEDYDKIIFVFSAGGNSPETGGVLIDRVRILENFNSGDVILNTWLRLTDTDNTYENKAGYVPVVKVDETGLKLTAFSDLTTTPDLQAVTDVGATTTNPMTVDVVNNSTVSGLIVQNNSGARSSLGISTDSGDSVGSMSFKNEETLGIAEIYISKDATTPSLLVLPQRPDTTPRVLGVGVTDGSSTSYFNSEGIVDLSSLILPSGDLQAVLEAGEIATFSGAGYSSTVDLDIFNHNITLNTERTGIGYGRLELISSGADSFKLYAGKAGTEEHGIRYDGSGVVLFNNDGTTNLEFRLRGGTGGGSVLINTPTLLTSGSYYMPMFFQNSLVTGITANSQGIVDLSTLIAKTTTADTGTVINLANPIGNECNFLSANSNTTFTTTNTGGWAKVLINAASEPTVTGATKEVGGTFIANTDIYLIVQSTADGVKYFWSYKEVLPPTTFTVATLPTGTLGDEAIVTDAIAPTYLGALTGGGAVTCPVWYNGTIWVSR